MEMGSVIYEVMQHQMDTTRVRFAQNKKTGEYEKVVLNRPITESTLQSYRTIACNYLKYCKANHRVTITDKRGRMRDRACRHIEECRPHIQAYIDHLTSQGKSPSTVHTYAAGLCHFYGLPLAEYELPRRHTADYTRGRGGKASSARRDAQAEVSPRLAALATAVGCRRAEYAALRGDDLVTDERGHLCVRIRQGKGNKHQLQRVLPQHEDLVKEYFDGSSNYIFTKREMANKINLHAQRAALAWEAYQYYKHRLDTEPKYREQLRAELQARINASNQHNIEAAKKKGKRWDGVRWDEREFSGTYHLRGKNRALAQRLGRPLCYDKAALLAVSILHLSHFRNDVTIASYILAKSAARKDG